jgi:hypothetical protein
MKVLRFTIPIDENLRLAVLIDPPQDWRHLVSKDFFVERQIIYVLLYRRPYLKLEPSEFTDLRAVAIGTNGYFSSVGDEDKFYRCHFSNNIYLAGVAKILSTELHLKDPIANIHVTDLQCQEELARRKEQLVLLYAMLVEQVDNIRAEMYFELCLSVDLHAAINRIDALPEIIPPQLNMGMLTFDQFWEICDDWHKGMGDLAVGWGYSIPGIEKASATISDELAKVVHDLCGALVAKTIEEHGAQEEQV